MAVRVPGKAEHDLDQAKRSRKDHTECRKHYREAEEELGKASGKDIEIYGFEIDLKSNCVGEIEMKRRNGIFWALLLIVQTGSFTAVSASESAGHAHEYHRNTIYGFIGITGEDRRERAGTLAIEYERRFNQRWGLSAGVERALGDLDFTVFTAPVVLHAGKWGFYAGPGLEKPDDHGSEFLFRVGAVYEFEAGNVILAPKFNIDFVDGDTVLVGGLAIGFGF